MAQKQQGDSLRIHTQSIYEALKGAKGADRGELIEIQKPGGQMVLLRDIHIPTCAFLLWADFARNTYSQIAFAKQLEKSEVESILYQVVCICCDPQLVGAQGEKYGVNSTREKFAEQLFETCSASGVRLVFTRYASDWNIRFPASHSVQFGEAEFHRHGIEQVTGKPYTLDLFPFIDFKKSCGLARNADR